MSIVRELKKIPVKLKRLLSGISVGPSKHLLAETPLIMTLLVRNEEDIVERNLEHHFRQGVDHIIITNNASTDSTELIIRQHKYKSRITIIDEPSENHDQAKWVNRMADLAREKFGRCLIFHCDADEFWVSERGNIKMELLTFPFIDCLSVPVINVIPEIREFKPPDEYSNFYKVVRPRKTSNIIKDSEQASMYLFPYPNKVAYRCKNNMPHVGNGNHKLVDDKFYVTVLAKDIAIYHFPILGYEKFEMKVKQGGSAILSNPDLPPTTGWHWIRWYKAHSNGRLKEAYQQLLIDKQDASALISEGVIELDNRISSLIFGQRQA